MFGWKLREVYGRGSVFFRGAIPPRPSNFPHIEQHGVSVTLDAPPASDAYWSAKLSHETWGKASVICWRNPPPIPHTLLEFDSRLDDDERAAAKNARSCVSVEMAMATDNVLRDRKLLLRYLRCFMGDDGVIAFDSTAQKFWTREALDDELAHDADLDVEALFTMHFVCDGTDEKAGQGKVYWAHSHGLSELGVFDFDVLQPSPLLMGTAKDAFRAIAFQILERKVSTTSGDCLVFLPDGVVSFVPIEEFNRRANAADVELRGKRDDPSHTKNRVIACDRRRRGFLGWFADRHLRPSRLLSTIEDDHVMMLFTKGATNLMAARARKTFGVFWRKADELKDFKVEPLVKIGLRVDGDKPDDREHCWFEVHHCSDEYVDATLLSQPFHVSGMKAGDRGKHPTEEVSDWMILTPFGPITPRSMHIARFLLANKEEFLRMMVEQSDGKSS